MQITPRQSLVEFAHVLQGTLYEAVTSSVGPLSEKAELLIALMTLVPVQPHLAAPGGWNGRPARHRQALATAFMARAVYGFSSTRALLDRLRSDTQLLRLCGWNSASQLPHEATFSRAFHEFAQTQLPQRLHEAMIRKTQQGRLIGHIARDSTAIEARERYAEPPPPAPKKQAKQKQKERKAKSCQPNTPKNTIEQQRKMALKDLLAQLPRDCSLGVKKSSKGHLSYWRGYKLHLDVADGDIPVSAVLTAARLHDSQAAVTLMNMTSERVTYLYDLMDAAYDAEAIREHSLFLNHQPIIDPVQRSRAIYTKIPTRKNSRKFTTVVTYEPIHRELAPAERQRFRQRTSVERVNSRLKDHFGLRSIYYRGADKISAHVMFAVLALAVDQWLKLSG